MVNVDLNLTPTATLFEIERGDHTLIDNASSNLGKIQGRSWGTASECYAACLLVHGLGGHSGWFEALARRLKVRRLFALSYDLVGFGKCINEHYVSPAQWLSDLKALFLHVQSLVGEKPIYLIGNSMGAVVALNACAQVKPAGLIMLSAAFAGHKQTFKQSYMLKTIIKALLRPNQEIQLPYTVDLITSLPTVRNWLANDPERRFAVPGKMLLDLLVMTSYLRWHKTKLSCPSLLLTAKEDQLIDNAVSEHVFENLSAPAKSSHCFSALHDLTLEPVIDEVANQITKWIGQEAPSKVIS